LSDRADDAAEQLASYYRENVADELKGERSQRRQAEAELKSLTAMTTVPVLRGTDR